MGIRLNMVVTTEVSQGYGSMDDFVIKLKYIIRE